MASEVLDMAGESTMASVLPILSMLALLLPLVLALVFSILYYGIQYMFICIYKVTSRFT